MRIKNTPLRAWSAGLTAALLLATTLPAAQAAEDDDARWEFGAGVDYSNGDYGTGIDTDIWSVPVSLGFGQGPVSLKLTVPYVRVSGASNVIPVVGSLINLNPIGRGRGRGLLDPPPPEETTSGSDSGLGDVVLAAGYQLYADADSGFGVDLTGKVKFGTADEDKGLGTGEEDYSALLDVYKRLGDWTVFGGAGYTFFGDSEFIRLNNAWSANAGAGYRFDSGDSMGVIYDYRERISAASEPRREATAYYSLRLSDATRLQSYVLAGFSDGSPDWGAGVSLKYGF